MNTDELYYKLPSKLIAQKPIEQRDASRLLVLDRKTGMIKHRFFRQIGEYLKSGDVLVVNDTKVMAARIKGSKVGTNAVIELLLLSPHDKNTWEVLARPAKRFKEGNVAIFKKGLRAEVIKELVSGRRLVRFNNKESLPTTVQNIGELPLPPYITKPLLNPHRYQTVYVENEESAAAPTAGLHFTPELIQSLKENGIKIAYISLRIGLDTFQPIREELVEKHNIHSEYFMIKQKAANLINEAKKKGHRIIAVGTTSARVLETVAAKKDINPREGSTDLFIYPGYRFQLVDAMITNFHLPRSTLLAMVSAFCEPEKIKKAYAEAIKKEYRFFSLGDAMLIL